ncbi:30S ribosomal protein S4 [Patescibacteria group bacterium]|nr:30S ribosomal protein S4 [Patescibacteria group bacterium]
MPKYLGPKGKVVRRLGVNVFGNPKFDKVLAKRPYAPGIHGPVTKGRKRVSEYGRQLVEKQKLKFTYGLREKQFRKLFEKAQSMEGVTGHNLLTLLERRLDMIVYRARMAATKDAARQLISHGHVLVNGRRVDVPSYSVKKDDVITVKEATRSKGIVMRNLKENGMREAPEWLEVNDKDAECTVFKYPVGAEIQSPADLQMIVELYSR